MPSALLLKQMFGKQLALVNLISTSILMSILWFSIFELPELIPIPSYQIPTIPCDYQAIAGVLFFMTIILRKPYLLLRHPRLNLMVICCRYNLLPETACMFLFCKKKDVRGRSFYGSVLFCQIYFIVHI